LRWMPRLQTRRRVTIGLKLEVGWKEVAGEGKLRHNVRGQGGEPCFQRRRHATMMRNCEAGERN
jgi:hypothetical protein